MQSQLQRRLSPVPHCPSSILERVRGQGTGGVIQQQYGSHRRQRSSSRLAHKLSIGQCVTASRFSWHFFFFLEWWSVATAHTGRSKEDIPYVDALWMITSKGVFLAACEPSCQRYDCSLILATQPQPQPSIAMVHPSITITYLYGVLILTFNVLSCRYN